jgi:hypothetical protein
MDEFVEEKGRITRVKEGLDNISTAALKPLKLGEVCCTSHLKIPHFAAPFDTVDSLESLSKST